MKYGESSIAVSTHPRAAELHELWIMKEYGVVESWTKVLTLHSILRNTHIPRVMWFRKNGEVLFQVHFVKMASFDLNCQNIELHGVDIGANLFSVHSYVESLVLLDKAVHVRSESDVNHPFESSIRMNRVGERVI
ncbi:CONSTITUTIVE EXPRESSER OF PR GENES 1, CONSTITUTIVE EXPRESSER OF PR GENES 30 [Hibiscus trionum]|uniref:CONSTITUTIVE EXPRESSER OF PR GENES 1, CONSTITUTIVE EXPRESSER OF PR GENES 30 n=1 Tax=Hibiscus trionum TaxID=183268 RepID=A0A9W7HKH1_HIBTR|nr:CONSTITUTIVE EXPRESSER OF PR GENES 1, CONSTITUTIVE EXPRESSER OF PR GENES 30 [Hibiscus trionum]